jgi:molecular chaperone GrpE (heat shock protein)
MADGRDAATAEERAAAERENDAGSGTASEIGVESPAAEPAPALEGEDLEAFRRLSAELAEYRELTRRARADLDRLEQRGGDRALLPDELLERLFPFLDGLQAAAASSGGEGFLAGLEVLRRELFSVLGALGATRITPRPGEPFDAACMTPDAGEPPERAEVSAVLDPGWKVGGTVVAPARVALREVATEEEAPPSGEPEKG